MGMPLLNSNLFPYESLRKAVLDRNPFQYEQLQEGAEGYRCFWCGKWTRQDEPYSHKDDCVYAELEKQVEIGP